MPLAATLPAPLPALLPAPRSPLRAESLSLNLFLARVANLHPLATSTKCSKKGSVKFRFKVRSENKRTEGGPENEEEEEEEDDETARRLLGVEVPLLSLSLTLSCSVVPCEDFEEDKISLLLSTTRGKEEVMEQRQGSMAGSHAISLKLW